MVEQKVIKVLLVDDHKMVRDGLQSTINKQQDLTVIGGASNGKEAVAFVHEKSPDVIVMDVNMPIMDGIEATKQIMSDIPNVTVIGLSLHTSTTVKESMLEAGASTYLTKDKAAKTLCTTIRNVVNSKKEHQSSNSN